MSVTSSHITHHNQFPHIVGALSQLAPATRLPSPHSWRRVQCDAAIRLLSPGSFSTLALDPSLAWFEWRRGRAQSLSP